MGLLTTYDANNKIIINDKTVSYSQKRVTGTWTYMPFPWQDVTYSWMWEYHRYCSKSYMYVGMDLTTANACAAAMITKYTRPFYVSSWTDSGTWEVVPGGSMLMAEVTVQQRAGCMYDVLINVREDDSRMSKTADSPASLFTIENARDYD